MSRAGSGVRGQAGQRVDGFKPPRDRIVSSRAVVCPACAAGLGEPCLTLDGRPRSTHKPRRRMAVRLDNEARGI